MSWVRFHEELCEDEKASLPRSARFVYMQLSLKARPRRGHVVLPIGLDDVKAVQLILPGAPREVAEAVRVLSAGPDPMIRFEDIDGKRALVVVNWQKWNPGHDDSGDRVRAHRKRAKERDGNALQEVTVTGCNEGEPLPSARARANLPSFSLVSDLQDPDPESLGDPSKTSTSDEPDATPEDRPSEVRSLPVPRRAENQDADGCFGDAVRGWGEGIRSVTGNRIIVPQRGGELDKLVAAIATHHPTIAGRDAWARQAGADFARSEPPALNVHKFVDWLNGGRKPLGRGPRAVKVQPVPEGGSEWVAGEFGIFDGTAGGQNGK